MYVENWELKQDLPRQNPVPERQDFFFFFLVRHIDQR